jgi:NAD-dependent DNA ligase
MLEQLENKRLLELNNKPSQAHDFPKIGAPATGALIHAGYTRLEQLTKFSEKELLALHGVGPKAVRILREALAEKGLAFAPEKQ